MLIIWFMLFCAACMFLFLLSKERLSKRAKEDLEEALDLLEAEETKVLAAKLREKASKLKGETNESAKVDE